MADNKPSDSAGRPLRQGAGAVQQPADRWAEWTRWGEQVNRVLAAKANQAAVDATDAAILDALERSIRSTVKNAAEAVGKLAGLIKEERTAREALTTSCQAAVSELEARIVALETGGGRSTPALSEAEFGAMQARLRATLAVGLNELAAARLGDKNRPAAANERAGNMPRLTGEARGEVISRGN